MNLLTTSMCVCLWAAPFAANRPVMAAQQYYLSSMTNGTVGNRLSSAGAVSTVGAPTAETCPTGITPNWTSVSEYWSTFNPNIPANAICFVEDTNSLGDELLLAGDAYKVTHTGAITNLTQLYKILVATGINTAGDIVGYANYDATQSQFVGPQSDGGGCSMAALAALVPNGLGCHSVGVLLKAGTSTLIDLNTVLSSSLSVAESGQGLCWYAAAIADNGDILVKTHSGSTFGDPHHIYNIASLVLVPCTAGSCPPDAY